MTDKIVTNIVHPLFLYYTIIQIAT